MKIGIFDSGIGGEKIAQRIKQEFNNITVITVNDAKNLPYGNKTKQQLLTLVVPILKKLERRGCDVIIIACNTVTTVLIDDLRDIINVPLIGFEPMIKPAAKKTKTKTITICATPATLNSDRYAQLKEEYARNVTVIEPDCSNWATLIEENAITKQEIKEVVDVALKANADVIVLGCTHYHWIEEEIRELAGADINIIQPEDAIIKRLRTTIKELTK